MGSHTDAGVEEVRSTPREEVPGLVCPDCGRKMREREESGGEWICLNCKNVQRVERLGEQAAERQHSHLHSRGVDRLRDAIRSHRTA